MRSFPRTGCRRASAAVAAVAVGVGLLSVLNGPSANAGELRDRQKAVHKKIAQGRPRARGVQHRAAPGHPGALPRPRAADRGARRAGRRTGPAGDRAAARRGDEGGALGRRGPSRAGPRRRRHGKDALQTQRDTVVDTITSLYQQGDPDLMAFTAILNFETPSDITRQREANRSLVELQGNEYDDLHAAEVLLKVHEDEVETATAEVAEQAPGGRRPPRRDAGPHPGGAGRQGTRQEPGGESQGRRGDGLRGQAEGPRGAAQAEEAGSQDPEADPGGDPQGPRARSRKAARAAAKANQGRPADRHQRSADAPGQRRGHLALRLPRAPDLPILGPARRRRLRRPLRRPAVRRRAAARC